MNFQQMLNSRLKFKAIATFLLKAVCLVSLLFVFMSDSGAEAIQVHEIEAAFIFQFTNYIDWPIEASGKTTEPFVIAVVGPSPISVKLKELASSKMVKGRNVEIRENPTAEQLKKSEIVVLGYKTQEHLRDVLSRLGNSSALIVTSGEGLGAEGATINFFIESERVRFEINRQAAEKQGLQISSQLLKLAKVIE